MVTFENLVYMKISGCFINFALTILYLQFEKNFLKILCLHFYFYISYFSVNFMQSLKKMYLIDVQKTGGQKGT